MNIVLGKLKLLFIFLSGFFCYFLMVLIMKIPLIQHLTSLPDRIIFHGDPLIDPVLAYIFIVGFFEVLIIFLYRYFVLRKSNKLFEAILFGVAFGFGVYSRFFSFSPAVAPKLPDWTPIRLLAEFPLLLLHTLLAVLIWNGFVIKKRALYFVIGVVFRMLATAVSFNSIRPFGTYSNEIIVFVIALILGGFLLYNCKLEKPNFDE